MHQQAAVPTTFSQKVDLAILYAQRESKKRVKGLFAGLAVTMAERDLDFAIANNFPEDYIANAIETHLEASMAELDWESYEQHGSEPGFRCWNSGVRSNTPDLEVWVTVEYMPRLFKFHVEKHTDDESSLIDSAMTLDEAILIAKKVISDDLADQEEQAA